MSVIGHRDITVAYRACDGAKKTRRFKTLRGAMKFAHDYIGEAPTIGGTYAVSDDGIGTIYVNGATLHELFPKGC